MRRRDVKIDFLYVCAENYSELSKFEEREKKKDLQRNLKLDTMSEKIDYCSGQ